MVVQIFTSLAEEVIAGSKYRHKPRIAFKTLLNWGSPTVKADSKVRYSGATVSHPVLFPRKDWIL